MSKKMKIGYSMLNVKDRMVAAGIAPLAWLCGLFLRLIGLNEVELERLALA